MRVGAVTMRGESVMRGVRGGSGGSGRQEIEIPVGRVVGGQDTRCVVASFDGAQRLQDCHRSLQPDGNEGVGRIERWERERVSTVFPTGQVRAVRRSNCKDFGS